MLTNDRRTAAAALITRYARRMLIENALSDAVRFFHMNALSSAVGLKVDFDMALLVIASGMYRLLARQMRGYDDAQARRVYRDLVDMPASVRIASDAVHVHFHRRAHLNSSCSTLSAPKSQASARAISRSSRCQYHQSPNKPKLPPSSSTSTPNSRHSKPAGTKPTPSNKP